jgi:Ion transport protein
MSFFASQAYGPSSANTAMQSVRANRRARKLVHAKSLYIRREADINDSHWRKRLYILLDDPSSSIVAKTISILVSTIIVMSSVTLCVETLPQYRTKDGREDIPAFEMIELIAVIVFTVEYALRLATVSTMSDEYFRDEDDEEEEENNLSRSTTQASMVCVY